MRSKLRLLGASVCALCLLAVPVAAIGDPGEEHGHDDVVVPPPTQPKSPPGIENMELLGLSDKDGTTNSDIAFYKNLAYVGNYDGFRIIDIRNPRAMQVLSDTTCRANQGDLSIFRSRRGRMIMLQSIDRPVSAPDCTAVDQPVVAETENGAPVERRRFGYEGLRMFDVTDPRNPKFLRFYRTECGSHTHTLVPDEKAVHAYVASYPLGSNITPQVDKEEADRRGLNCDAPHRKISIVTLPLDDPENGYVRKKRLSSDTEPYDPDGPEHAPAFKACHDHQAFLPRNIMVASCAGDAQYWDISDRDDPTSANGERHTHIKREVPADDPNTPEDQRTESFDFIHNATVSWDGRVAGIVDESGGGSEPRCDGSNSKRGFTFFYPLVRPGQPVNGFDELGRYMIPRPQGDEICVSHNGNVLPTTNGRRWQVQAFYQGGNSFVDFTNPGSPRERGFADLEDPATGAADSWSSYWYNDVMFVNGGLNRRGATGNRGFEAYALFQGGDRVETRDWKWLNPQTQEAWQVPKKSKRDDD